MDDKVHKEYQYMRQEGDNTLVNINLLSTQSKWILLTQVKEIISIFGLYYTLMSGFLNMEMWSCGSWADSLLPVSKDR